jgi:hypothetical protein
MHLKWRLSHISGYLELGLVSQAAAELQAIPRQDRRRSEVLPARMAVLQAQEKWGALRTAARAWVKHQPEDPGGWITWAYATRRSVSLHAAEAILLNGLKRHPREATLLFNLSCYASVRGDQALARDFLTRAVAVDKAFATLARTDPDLAGLRAEG